MVTAGMAVAGTAEKEAKGTEAQAAKMYRRMEEIEFHLLLHILLREIVMVVVTHGEVVRMNRMVGVAVAVEMVALSLL
jgi:hypothetical protein